MPVKARILFEEHDVHTRLNELNLPIELLTEVVRQYALSLNSQTKDHPTWGRAITPASEAIFALRNRMKLYGWFNSDENGFALTVHPEELLAVNVATGDSGTGDCLVNVSTSSDKGRCTVVAVDSNQYVLDIPPPEVTPSEARCPFWYLLIRRKGEAFYSELSLPVGMEEKKISLWAERIILPVVRADDLLPPDSPVPEADEYEVTLARRK